MCGKTNARSSGFFFSWIAKYGVILSMSTNAESINSMTHQFSVQLAEIFGNSEEDIYHTCILFRKNMFFSWKEELNHQSLRVPMVFFKKIWQVKNLLVGENLLVQRLKNLLVLELIFTNQKSEPTAEPLPSTAAQHDHSNLPGEVTFLASHMYMYTVFIIQTYLMYVNAKYMYLFKIYCCSTSTSDMYAFHSNKFTLKLVTCVWQGQVFCLRKHLWNIFKIATLQRIQRIGSSKGFSSSIWLLWSIETQREFDFHGEGLLCPDQKNLHYWKRPFSWEELILFAVWMRSRNLLMLNTSNQFQLPWVADIFFMLNVQLKQVSNSPRFLNNPLQRYPSFHGRP